MAESVCTSAALPPVVLPILEELHAGARAALGANFLGLYLRGSLALGAFDPLTSDIDFLVVTSGPVTVPEFDRLATLHSGLAALPDRYARELEGSYIDRRSLRRFGPAERVHPSIGVDWDFQRRAHRDNWVLERWVIRERGVALSGPDPRTLVAPIGERALRLATWAELEARVDHWAARPGMPGWLAPRNYQAFEVETLCRALFTLARGALPTKPQAVDWALATLPEVWRRLVADSHSWRTDPTEDATRVEDVKAFARWAVETAPRPAGSSLLGSPHAGEGTRL